MMTLSSNSVIVTRVQWPVGSDPEDWVGIGSGFEDLVDMIGFPSRIFAEEDRMILATTKEIWQGRKVGGPFRFRFTPLARELGMPFPSAAIRTPSGIFWLNDDYMVYRLVGNSIQAVGKPILNSLRNELEFTAQGQITTNERGLFMSYNPAQLSMTLHYTSNFTSFPQGTNQGFTLHLAEGNVWTPFTSTLSMTAATHFNWRDLRGGTNYPTTVFGSTYSAGAFTFSEETNLDFGNSFEARYTSGGMFTGDAENTKFLEGVRLDLRGNSASSMTVSASGDLGRTFGSGASQQIAISADSNSTQVFVPFTVSGLYHALEFRSEDTGWELTRVQAKARILGKHF